MKDIISWILLTMSAFGAIYAIGLVISYFILPKDFNDVDLDEIPGCDCYRCERR
jgi:hypothetical protein